MWHHHRQMHKICTSHQWRRPTTNLLLHLPAGVPFNVRKIRPTLAQTHRIHRHRQTNHRNWPQVQQQNVKIFKVTKPFTFSSFHFDVTNSIPEHIQFFQNNVEYFRQKLFEYCEGICAILAPTSVKVVLTVNREDTTLNYNTNESYALDLRTTGTYNLKQISSHPPNYLVAFRKWSNRRDHLRHNFWCQTRLRNPPPIDSTLQTPREWATTGPRDGNHCQNPRQTVLPAPGSSLGHRQKLSTNGRHQEATGRYGRHETKRLPLARHWFTEFSTGIAESPSTVQVSGGWWGVFRSQTLLKCLVGMVLIPQTKPTLQTP